MILHCGEALIDFIPVTDPDRKPAYTPSPGGSPYNCSIATARLGVSAAFLGRISRDFFGDQLVSNLEANSVATNFIVRSDQPSTLAFVKKTESGEARYAFFVNDAADRGLLPDDLPEETPPEAACIQIGSISLIPDPVSETILSFAETEADRRVISFDPNIRSVLVGNDDDYRQRVRRALAASSIVKISDEDLAWLIPDRPIENAAAELVSGRSSLIVVTRGAEGAFAFTPTSRVDVPGIPVSVSDTVGAGDSFHAALLAWLYRNDLLTIDSVRSLDTRQLEDMLGFAVEVSSQTCSRAGADPPRLSELS
jgi:fructokinase